MDISRRTTLGLLAGALLRPASAQNSGTLYKSKRIALLIGNSKYKNTAPLLGPSRDVQLVAEEFRALNFSPVWVENDLELSLFGKRLWAFKNEAKVSDVAVLYYSGHGIEIGGTNYLIPTDATLEDSFAVDVTTVPASHAVRAVSEARSLGFLVLDACRNNPFLAKLKMEGGTIRQYTAGLAPMAATQSNVLIQFAAAQGELARDGTSTEGSPFARAFVKAISAPGSPVMQIAQEVTGAVLKETGDQRPFFAGSLSETLYLMPPPSAPVPLAAASLVVDLQFADLEDPVVVDLLKPVNTYKFGYSFEKKLEGSAYRILEPDLKYFVSLRKRGRPHIVAEENGYFSPEEGSGWGVSYPVLDVIARRASDQVVTLSELVFDVEKSSPDLRPYVDLISPDVQFGTLKLYNEGWTNVQAAVLEYDVLGFRPPPDESTIEQVLKSKRDGGYKYSVQTGPFAESVDINLEKGLSDAIPDLSFYKYAFNHPPQSTWTGSEEPPLPKKGPPGYVKWVAAHREVLNGLVERPQLWIVGRLIITSNNLSKDVTIVDMSGSVPIYYPEVGGGTIGYDIVRQIRFKMEGANYSVRQPLGYLLDQDTKTFRALLPLHVDKTSDHRFRITLKGDGGKELYVSDWVQAKIVVPRMSLKFANKPGVAQRKTNARNFVVQDARTTMQD